VEGGDDVSDKVGFVCEGGAEAAFAGDFGGGSSAVQVDGGVVAVDGERMDVGGGLQRLLFLQFVKFLDGAGGLPHLLRDGSSDLEDGESYGFVAMVEEAEEVGCIKSVFWLSLSSFWLMINASKESRPNGGNADRRIPSWGPR